ncbi:FAD-binding domain-containing protein [Ascodesmis nigricans]|uniref:FAD-binding domain-containing protein n=1 Tax=Ascodesmis nigricans TaxID=341454 RepID=A0A4S2MTY0_9PEZI|nr:FAD-binding domain-containing protein [Ascodesmis nigricans]
MKSFFFASFLALATGAAAHLETYASCAALEILHSKKLMYPRDTQYNVTNENYFDVASVKRPACIFLPESAKDVSDAIRILRITKTKFALKSGGHMPGEFTNIDGGVLIATERLNTLKWAENDSVLQVGPGIRWGPVFDEAATKGKVVIGGRLKVVGVAGLLVGGGISYVAGEYGFSCDNIKGFEVVLADGTITYASETRNKDLYKALRGGTSNFGIVTRFDMDTYDLPIGYSNIGMVVFNPAPGVDFKPAFMDALADFVVTGSAADVKSGAIITVTRVPSRGMSLGMMSLWRSEPVANATTDTPDVFKKLVTIPGQHSANNLPLNVVANTFGSQESQGDGGIQLHLHNTFRTGSYIADKDLILEIEQIHEEEFATIADVAGLSATITFQPITQNNIRVGASKRGGNVMGLENRLKAGDDRHFMWTEQFAGWALDADTARVDQVQKNIYNRAKAAAQKRGLWDDFIYLNDAATDQAKDVFPAFGEKNHMFLKSTKQKYDPTGVFTNLMPGGFKI